MLWTIGAWRMKNFGWRQWLIVLAFVLAVLFTGIFAMRTVRRAAYWHNHKDEPIRPWVSIGYIAHSYRVPPYVLTEAPCFPPKTYRLPIQEKPLQPKRSA